MVVAIVVVPSIFAFANKFDLSATQGLTTGLTTGFTYDASGNVLTKTLTDTTTTTAPYSTRRPDTDLEL